MVALSSRFLSCLAILAFLMLAACSGTKTVLIPKSAVVPIGVDLSGRWLVRDGEKTRRPTSGRDEDGIDIGERKRPRSRKSRKSSGSSAHVFLEYGHSLKITQTHFAIFISYDRSIVEEFRFGENRLVAVGPIEAMRVSGWEGNVFAIETLDESNSILAESWQLQDDDQVLVRDIRISSGELEIFSQQQIFDRQ